MHSVRLSTLSYFIYSVLLFHFALPLYFRYFLIIISIVSIVVIIRPCHKAAIPGGGVLPYMGHIGMCRCEGYGVQAVYSSIGYINQSVWV